MTESRSPLRSGPARGGLGIAFALAVATVTGCSAVAAAGASSGTSADAGTASTNGATLPAGIAEIQDANADQTVVNDDEWSAADAVDIALSGTSAETSSSAVTVGDGTVTITAAGVYRLSGDYAGSVVVDAADDAQVVLILDGVDIAAEGAPAIRVTSADDVAVYLAEGSANSVTATGTAGTDANAAIWADADLTLSGTGSLAVQGDEDGIRSKDDLVVLSGSIDVTSGDDGLRGTDSLTVRGGTVTVDAGGDGISSDQDADETQGWVSIEGGTIDVTAGSDGIDGYTDVIITAGDIAIAAEEGIEAGTIAIADGTIDIVATDDGINGSAGTSSDTATGEESAGGMGGGGMQDTGEYVLIAGGQITIDSEGDGLDSNGSMSITGGTTLVSGPTRSGNGALDTNGALTVSGGTILALDSGGMSGSPAADSAQAWVAAWASGAAGSTVEVVASDGTVLLSTTAEKAFGALVFSSADVVAGETYTVTVDGAEVASATTGQALAGGMGGGMDGGGPGGAPGGARP